MLTSGASEEFKCSDAVKKALASPTHSRSQKSLSKKASMQAFERHALRRLGVCG